MKVRVSQLLAALSCVIAVAVLLAMSFKTHSKAKLYVNQVVLDEEDEEDEEEEAEAEEAAETEETEETEEAEETEETE